MRHVLVSGAHCSGVAGLWRTLTLTLLMPQILFLVLVTVEQRCLWRRASLCQGASEGSGGDDVVEPLLDSVPAAADAGAPHKAVDLYGS